MQEEGKLSLDDAIGKYIPALPVAIKLRFANCFAYLGLSGLLAGRLRDDHDEADGNCAADHGRVGKKALDFEPGTQWQYSNTNFVIAGAIVEKVSGEPYFKFLTERIFNPLGMTSIGTPIRRSYRSRHDALLSACAWPVRVAPKEGSGLDVCCGELAMTAHDLALWDASMIAQSLLKPESYKQMFTEVKLANGKGTHYGLGVDVRDLSGIREIEHGGEVSGFVSENAVLVDDGAAVVVLTNQDAIEAASSIARLAAPLVAAIPPSPEEKLVSRYIS